MIFTNSSLDNLHFLVDQNSSQATTSLSGTLSADTDYLVVITADGSGNMKAALNATSFSSYSYTDPGGSDTNANQRAQISGRSEGATQPLQATDRIKCFAAGNEYLSDAQLSSIVSHYETRHSVDYTP